MAITVQKTPVSGLDIGMYVSKLDRPWAETPFLFQGFTITTSEEIEELRRYCKFVYVEESVEPLQPGGIRRKSFAPSASSKRQASGGFSWLARGLKKPSDPAPHPGEFYEDTVSLRVELPQAKAIHDNASGMLANIMEGIRRGRKLDVHVLESAVNPIIESVLRNRDAMTWLSRIKRADDYTYGHAISCSVYAIAFGRHLGLPKDDLKALGLGGMLLDVGKTRIPKSLLAKPDPLTHDELTLMRRHVEFGLEIVGQVPDMDNRVTIMVRSHHERYDGSGYPDGLKGAEIPVFARIAGIADFYDAVTTARPYALPVSSYDAIRMLHEGEDQEFQKEMVEHFVQTIGMFPNGVLVELSTGEVGVVIEQNRIRRLRPKVMIILDADKRSLSTIKTVNLLELPSRAGESGAIWINRGLPVGAYDIDPSEYFL